MTTRLLDLFSINRIHRQTVNIISNFIYGQANNCTIPCDTTQRTRPFGQLTFALSTGRHSDPSKQLITLSKLSSGNVPFALTENTLIWRRYVKVGVDGRCKWRDQIALPLICHREKRTPTFASVALLVFLKVKAANKKVCWF